MSNPFGRHGIDHLSPSSLALYRKQPSLWCLRYLHGIKDEANAAMWRGSAVEAGVDKILYEQCSDDTAIEAALQTFELNAQGDLSDEVQKERAAIPDFVRQAGVMFRPLGVPDARQLKIEYWVDGVEVPVIGFIDYKWPEFLYDLKTTYRLPSEPRSDHAIQVSIYAEAKGVRPWLSYVTPKKGAAFPVDDREQALWVVKRSARAIRAMLERAADKNEAASFFAPDFESYLWNDAGKAKALELLA